MICLIAGSNNIFADTNAINITKGTPAPFTGVLITKPVADALTKELVSCAICQQQNDSYKKSIAIYKENEDLYLKENTELKQVNVQAIEALQKANNNGLLVKITAFSAGVLLTSIAYHEFKR